MKIKILTNKLTPKYLINDHCIDVEDFSLEDSHQFDAIVDLTVSSTLDKTHLIQQLLMEYKGKVIVDTSTCWGESISHKFPTVSAFISLCFYSPKNTHEVHLMDGSIRDLINHLFKIYKKEYITVNSAGLGFTYPRVVSMIINEAFFSIEDELASREDIDTAMKFGVNYPHGPFEWSELIGTEIIQTLLDELYGHTGDPRYRSSLKLVLTN